MSVAAVIAAALLAAPPAGGVSDPLDTVLRLRAEFAFEYAQPQETQRAWQDEPAPEHVVRFGTPMMGGAVIRQYRCDRNGVLDHRVISAYPEIHARPFTPGEHQIIDIGPDYGVLPDAPDGD